MTQTTVASLVSADAVKPIDGLPPYFCRTPDCEALYFTGSALIANKTDAVVRVGLKETEGLRPICYCFGFTYDDVAEDFANCARTGPTIAARIRAEVQAGRCDCERRNPGGSCCLGDVQRASTASAHLSRLNASETTDGTAQGGNTHGLR